MRKAERRESRGGDAASGGPPAQSGTAAEQRSVASSAVFRVGRLLFGGVLAFMALDNLRNLDERIQYAEAKGAPAPDKTVPGISVALLLGSGGVTFWRLPSLSAAAVAAFFVSVTPVMHDFWEQDDPEQRQQQFIHFMKNAALLGGALVLLKVARRSD